jgi:hypothetical protein
MRGLAEGESFVTEPCTLPLPDVPGCIPDGRLISVDGIVLSWVPLVWASAGPIAVRSAAAAIAIALTELYAIVQSSLLAVLRVQPECQQR